ncbi:MAG: RnfABCDGE type electron transport complex subunit D [Minisyncoccia bacterium]
MMNFIDKKLNVVTMYRLVLYYLMTLLVFAMVFGYLGFLPYTPLALVISVVYITAVCYAINTIFSRVFKAPTNIESMYITALILVFLITPIKSFVDTDFYIIGLWAGILSMATKYILAIRSKHIFNPAAVALVLTSFALGLSASWWIGNPWMVLPVVVGGFLIVRKILRWDLVLSFFLASFIAIIFYHSSGSYFTDFSRFLFSSSAFFFAFVMLTEPLTTPPTKYLRIVYGLIVGFLFAPATHIGSFYFSPELALVVGNIFSYTVSPKEKLILKLVQIKVVAKDTYDFIFSSNRKFSFRPGQYMEWTFAHNNPDNRGNRRYFTIASSPTEDTIRIGLKFYPEMSSYKNNLLNLKAGDVIVASQRAGDFTLPKNKNKKLAFIAGGIGITPFRSMLKSLVDTNEKRDIVSFYSNKTIEDIAYINIFDEAYEKLGIQTVYTLSDAGVPPTWTGERGFITAEMIKKYAPDYMERYFYISGPHMMVTTFEKVLKDMGVKSRHIKTDFFPGFV